MTFALTPELQYVVLLFSLFVVPQFLKRFRVPTPITCVLLGLGAGMGLHMFSADATVEMLASLGIISLFLFAGLDVDFQEMKAERRILLQHVVLMLAGLLVVATIVTLATALDFRTAILVALALLTPSTGFILESLSSFATTQQERFWIRSLALGAELVALGVFFVVLQSFSVRQFSLSILALVALIVIVPVVFWLFAKTVVRYAPKSEFAFLLMVALVSAYVTRELGVYYLVGAFIVGVVAQRFRLRLPSLVSDNMLHAVEVFASVFIPVYFFKAGLHIQQADLSLRAAGIGLLCLAAIVPLRLLMTALHRRIALGEHLRRGLRISVAIIPTLVFSIVIAEILRDRFELSNELFGGIIIYALINTVLPTFVFKLPAPELDRAGKITEDAKAG
ncbi:cation:proton antiporter [candidate division KSB1 bacterium]|nr:cation:proton antiporter [candidate division KSB1 bacterium]